MVPNRNSIVPGPSGPDGGPDDPEPTVARGPIYQQALAEAQKSVELAMLAAQRSIERALEAMSRQMPGRTSEDPASVRSNFTPDAA